MSFTDDERKCYLLAGMHATYAEAATVAITKGYADDLADFDEKVREVEDHGGDA